MRKKETIIKTTKFKDMKAKELKKLKNEFIVFAFSGNNNNIDINQSVSEFWFAKFGVKNIERQKEFTEYFYNNE